LNFTLICEHRVDGVGDHPHVWTDSKNISTRAPVAHRLHFGESALRIIPTSAYGIDAMHSDGRGGNSVGMTFQCNFGKTMLASGSALEN
jgi:hypothetical protein